MSMAQLREWAEYDALEPFGERREDLRAGIVAAAIMNVNRSKKSDKVWAPQDFILEFSRETEKDVPFTDMDKWAKLKDSMKAYAVQAAPKKQQRKRRVAVPSV